eukprot:TRINITY_DN18784_c0_g1_i1.p1 TRINITY_DN18784_c0_g1~~TRINITY_DN18784_c0_g1_i1.p1  ORF type:complete len:334 (-),score=49.23 TRINITY_DN18784_c0_g1_i1:386-1387(-)
MASISIVTVTGASGFIGAHIVRECLERGFNVNACVRNKDDPKNKFLLDMAARIGKGNIKLFSADLVTKGAYDEAVSKANAVIHAAAQVDPGVIKDPWKDMVEPSVQGALNILSSVNKYNVKHYVHTSSMAAVGGAQGRPVTEGDWSTTTIEERPYDFAKREAEMVVWRETAGKPYSVSCINPSMVFGPCLAKPHAKASPYVFRQALYGNPQPNQPYSVVDVRDVAFAHVEAMLRPEANGHRFILDGNEPSIAVNDIIEKCRARFPQYQFGDAPGSKGWDEKLFGRKPSSSSTDNSRSRKVLGVKYTPMDTTIFDTVDSMIKNGFVPARPSSKL